MNPILYWNDVALEVHRRDFTVNKDGEGMTPGLLEQKQGGPTRVSRAFAIVHIAMYEAVAQIVGGTAPYDPLANDASVNYTPVVPAGTSVEAAIASAAVTTLTNLFDDRRLRRYIVRKSEEYLLELGRQGQSAQSINDGVRFGDEVGDAMIRHRKNDGSDMDAWYQPAPLKGMHREDPFSPGQGYLGARWQRVKPFAIAFDGSNASLANYLDPHPPLSSAEYKADYLEVRDKGTTENTASSSNNKRTADETVIGIYWGYDGAAGLGVPPRLYNQLTRAVVEKMNTTSTVELAQIFAKVNAGMADAGIVAWAGKYTYNLWRPVIGIRENAKDFGPIPGATGVSANDDAMWAPLGLPRTNRLGEYHRTPDFPAYPSGHATFGAVTCDLLKAHYNKNVAFTLVSDEFNGVNVDPSGSPRPVHHRDLTLDKAKVENAVSRVYLGVHWRFDGIPPKGSPAGSKIGGVPAGEAIAKEITSGLHFK